MDAHLIKAIKMKFQNTGIFLDFDKCQEVDRLGEARVGDMFEIPCANSNITVELTNFIVNVTQGKKTIEIAVGVDKNGKPYYLILGKEENRPSEYANYCIN